MASLFGNPDEVRRKVNEERLARVQQIGGASPWAMAGALFGTLAGGGIDRDPRVQRANKLQAIRQSVESEGFDLATKPVESLGLLASRLQEAGLSDEAYSVTSQLQKHQESQARAQAAEALAGYRGQQQQNALAKEVRATELHGGALSRQRSDAQAAEVKAKYADQKAQLDIQGKLATIQAQQMSAQASLLNAQNSQYIRASNAELKALDVQKKTLEIEGLKRTLASGGMSQGDIAKGVTAMSKQAEKLGIPETQNKLDKLRKIGTSGVGFLKNAAKFPAFLKSERGQAFAQQYQSLVNVRGNKLFGASLTGHELDNRNKELGIHISQGPDAVVRGMQIMQEETDAKWQNLLRGYGAPVKEQFERNYPMPDAAPAPATGAPTDDELDEYLK